VLSCTRSAKRKSAFHSRVSVHAAERVIPGRLRTLCVDLDYQGSTRRIEPYSLRRTKDGNIVLHAFNLDRNEHRGYRVDRITGARATSRTFVPRYAVELTPSGQVSVLPTRAGIAAIATSRSRLRPAGRPARGSSGPAYIYQCPVCQKKFRRHTRDSALKAHQSPAGYPCSGRRGYLVDTQY
jgi:predicted DNA-binding transcriptional regulator YafY